jgi:hypothetical protein
MDKHNTVEIILLKNEIIHAVQSDIQRFERTRKMQDAPVLLDNEADRYTMCGYIDEAVNEAVRIMQAYLMVPSSFSHRVTNNHTDDWDEISIRLAMPINWPPHLLDSLKNAVHKFVVRKAEYSLLSVNVPEDPFTIMCERFADTHYNEIESIISDRIGPIHTSPMPLGL